MPLRIGLEPRAPNPNCLKPQIQPFHANLWSRSLGRLLDALLADLRCMWCLDLLGGLHPHPCEGLSSRRLGRAGGLHRHLLDHLFFGAPVFAAFPLCIFAFTLFDLALFALAFLICLVSFLWSAWHLFARCLRDLHPYAGGFEAHFLKGLLRLRAGLVVSFG